MRNKTIISFVIPCYRSEKTIESVINEIDKTVSQREQFDYEIIAVNDCSPDAVYDVLRRIAEENKRVKLVNLVKNGGKHAAVLAGYRFVSGDYIVNLDDDYQSPLNRLWDLLDPVLNDTCDVATALFNVKKEPIWKRLGSNINMRVSDIMMDKPKGLRFESFSVLKRFVAEQVIQYENPYPYLEGLIYRVTRRIVSIPMEQRERLDQKKSGYNLKKSVALFANGFTNFSVKPLRIALIIGLVFAFLGFGYGIYVVLRRVFHPEIYAGWSSLMAVVLFSSGVIMLLLGVIGEYVGRIFICINGFPQYVIRETVNVDDKTK